MSAMLPRIFIASSVERLKIAYTIQELLEFDGEVTVWTEGTFKPSSYTLDDLLTAIDSHLFGIFVFVPDDKLMQRENSSPAVRDNLIFEFGLFTGRHGRKNCFFVVPRDVSLHLPSDLAGLTPLTYADKRSDDNLLAALGPACNQVRRAIAEALSKHQPGAAAPVHLPRAQDYVKAWLSPELVEARELVRSSSLDLYDPDASKARMILRQLFSFLESMADAVLSGRVDDTALRSTFEQPVRALWPDMYTALAPPNHADEWWDPPPKLAELHGRWARLDAM